MKSGRERFQSVDSQNVICNTRPVELEIGQGNLEA
jgi:hypothetical protein